MPDSITRAHSRQENWRQELRRIVGSPGKLWRILLELAEGRAYRPVLPDGSEGPPVVPSPEIRLRAATELADRLYGKAVSQTEIVQAEQAASDLESVRALSDAELEAQVKGALERGLARLDAGKGIREVAAEWWAAPEGDLEPIDSNPPPVES